MSLYLLVPLVLLIGLILLPWAINRLCPAATALYLIRLRRRKAGLVDRAVEIDGIKIVYSEGGAGEPLILLHGFGADRSSFDMVAATLTKHYRVLIPDLPGFGASGRFADGNYRVSAQAEFLDRFARQLGLSRFHLGGNSMGGWIAAIYAARFPDKVASLWLLAAAGTADLQESEAVKARQEKGEYLLLVRTIDELKVFLRRIFVRPPFVPYCILWAGSRRAAAYYPLHTKIFDQMLTEGQQDLVEPILSDIKAPVLLVWGDQDSVVPLSAFASYRRLLPGAQTVLMPQIGHVPQMEAPEAVVEDYLRFRAGVAGV
jgi:abhydrolase domain-containing protein 6